MIFDKLSRNLPQDAPAFLLRVGLATVFLYAAVSSMVSPEDWVGYFPPPLLDVADGSTLVKVFSAYEVILALWLLTGWQVRAAALVTAVSLAGIIISNLGLLIITFRDIGLIFAALALAVLPKKR